MSIDYLGQTFKGDLLPNGQIKSQETGMFFKNPSAWAIYCKKIVKLGMCEFYEFYENIYKYMKKYI